MLATWWIRVRSVTAKSEGVSMREAILAIHVPERSNDLDSLPLARTARLQSYSNSNGQFWSPTWRIQRSHDQQPRFVGLTDQTIWDAHKKEMWDILNRLDWKAFVAPCGPAQTTKIKIGKVFNHSFLSASQTLVARLTGEEDEQRASEGAQTPKNSNTAVPKVKTDAGKHDFFPLFSFLILFN